MSMLRDIESQIGLTSDMRVVSPDQHPMSVLMPMATKVKSLTVFCLRKDDLQGWRPPYAPANIIPVHGDFLSVNRVIYPAEMWDFDLCFIQVKHSPPGTDNLLSHALELVRVGGKVVFSCDHEGYPGAFLGALAAKRTDWFAIPNHNQNPFNITTIIKKAGVPTP